MRSVILVILLFLVGCADPHGGAGSHAARDAFIRRYLQDGWRFVGVIVNDLVFEKDVAGGTIRRYISWWSPETYREEFVPTPRQPW